jgi:ATP-dependent protease Clp ATPase subunit
LIAGPKVYICDACVALAEGVLAGSGDLKRISRSGRDRCSFCRKRANRQTPIISGPQNICMDCLRICREILDSRAA